MSTDMFPEGFWDHMKKVSVERSVRLYICGPMSGLTDHNFPAFREAAAKLIAAGYEVTDPSTFEDNVGKPWADCLKRDIPELLKCDGVALLPGWTKSRGARLEQHIASSLDMRTQPVWWWLGNAGVYED